MSIIDILLHIAAAVLGYVIGSVNAAVIITKYILKSDVRERGSKNAASPYSSALRAARPLR